MQILRDVRHLTRYHSNSWNNHALCGYGTMTICMVLIPFPANGGHSVCAYSLELKFRAATPRRVLHPSSAVSQQPAALWNLTEWVLFLFFVFTGFIIP